MALRTLRSINKQVEEMKAQTIVAQTAANAARLNAQAVIDAERAWIFAELGLYQERIRILQGSSTFYGEGPFESTSIMNIKLTLKNHGKTPAWIDAIHAQVDIVDSASIAREPALDGGNHGPMQPIAAGAERSRSLELTCRGHRNQGEFLSVNVVIDYHDIFGINRQTVLGYSADEANLIPQFGLAERNQNT